MRPRLSYANVVATISLFLVLTGGAAYALDGSNTVFTDDIVNGDVKVADIGQGAVATDELKNDSIIGPDIAPDSLTGADVAANSLKGADIDEGTLDVGDAARAYAHVIPSLCSGTLVGPCTPEESKGVSRVTRLGEGEYCVTAPGIDAAATPAVVSVDQAHSAIPSRAVAVLVETETCTRTLAGFLVSTFHYGSRAIDDDGEVATVITPPFPSGSVSFTIVIP